MHDCCTDREDEYDATGADHEPDREYHDVLENHGKGDDHCTQRGQGVESRERWRQERAGPGRLGVGYALRLAMSPSSPCSRAAARSVRTSGLAE